MAAAVTVHQRLCDLGFFRSVDSRLPKLRSFKLPTFIKQIEEAFEEYPDEKLDDVCGIKTRVCAWPSSRIRVTITSVCHIGERSVNFVSGFG